MMQGIGALSVVCKDGLAHSNPIVTRDKRGASPGLSSHQTLDRQKQTTEVVAVQRQSYKEVLLTPAKQAIVGKKKRWKQIRRKMAHRNQERVGPESYRRDDRADRERNWDA
jgi:hypothetical protein